MNTKHEEYKELLKSCTDIGRSLVSTWYLHAKQNRKDLGIEWFENTIYSHSELRGIYEKPALLHCVEIPLLQAYFIIELHTGVKLLPDELRVENLLSYFSPVLAKDAYEYLKSLDPDDKSNCLREHAEIFDSIMLMDAFENGSFDDFKQAYNSLPTNSAKLFGLGIEFKQFNRNTRYSDEPVSKLLFACRKAIGNVDVKEYEWLHLLLRSTCIVDDEGSFDRVSREDLKKVIKGMLKKYGEVSNMLTSIEEGTIEQIISSRICSHVIEEVICEIESEHRTAIEEKLELPDNFFDTLLHEDRNKFLCEVLERYRVPKSLSALINYLGDKGCISPDIQTKKTLAFVLTGHGYESNMTLPIKWEGKPGVIAFVCRILYTEKKFGDRVTRDTYPKAMKLFDSEDNSKINAIYGDFNHLKKIYPDIEKQLEELFPREN